MKTVTINRKSWGRDTFCNIDTGKCCAIGFLAKSELERQGKKPSSNEIDNYADKLYDKEFRALSKIAGINDQEDGQERIRLLREEFNKLGYKLVFKN